MQTAAIAAPLIKNNAKRNAIFDVSPVATDSPITGLTDAVNLSCEKSAPTPTGALSVSANTSPSAIVPSAFLVIVPTDLTPSRIAE